MTYSDITIPFNKPFVVGKELYNIAKSVVEYSHLSGGGMFTDQCQAWLEKNLSCKRALLTHSCTGALELAALLCGIQPGDEVIMPSFTFVSTANAFVLRGGVPVFIDIRSDTLNMNEKLIEEAVTDRTKAIVPVHYAGISCAMDEICHIADKYNLFVIEDAAHAFLSCDDGKYSGSVGDLGTLSFHESKNIISGEGGALLINREDFIERAEIIWEKGTNRREFLDGRVDKYTWVDVGSSFQPSEMIAGFLFAQLEMGQKIIETRRKLFNLYNRLLKPLFDQGVISLPCCGDICESGSGHIFYVITGSKNERGKLIDYLKERGIQAVFHYIPLHSSPAGRKYGRASGSLVRTDDLCNRLLRLPIFFEMEEWQVEVVVEIINDFYLG